MTSLRWLALDLASLTQMGSKVTMVTNSIFLSGPLLSGHAFGLLRLRMWMSQHNPFWLLTLSCDIPQGAFVRLPGLGSGTMVSFLTGVCLHVCSRSSSVSHWNPFEACALRVWTENWDWRFSLGSGTWLTKCVAGTSFHSSVEYSGFLFHSLGWASGSHGGSTKGWIGTLLGRC